MAYRRRTSLTTVFPENRIASILILSPSSTRKTTRLSLSLIGSTVESTAAERNPSARYASRRAAFAFETSRRERGPPTLISAFPSFSLSFSWEVVSFLFPRNSRSPTFGRSTTIATSWTPPPTGSRSSRRSSKSPESQSLRNPFRRTSSS